METLTAPPREFYAGETPTWTWKDDAYSPAEGFNLEFQFTKGGDSFTAGGEPNAEGDGWNVQLPVAATEDKPDGKYHWLAIATRNTPAPSVRRIIGNGFSRLLAADGTTPTERDLAAVEAAIQELVTTKQCVSEYRIKDRQLKRYTMQELEQVRARLREQVSAERQARRAKSGSSYLRTVGVRFR
jgi:hypothetical protein